LKTNVVVILIVVVVILIVVTVVLILNYYYLITAATTINETFGIYNYSGITKPIARPFLESHFQSLVACRTPYLTGISIIFII
jgi:hypothetical protein